jgi:spore germination cell wall hydrolase CwlJ-like protein
MMQLKLKKIGFTPIAVMTFAAALNWQGASASAEALQPTLVESAPQVSFTAAPVVQPLPAVESATPAAPEAVVEQAGSLAQLVAAHGQPESLSPEMQCLAGAIYFESKGQTLAGQLAVGRVIVGRTKSGRFPESYCGVVYQRSQFSFVRGRSMPAIATRSPAWQQAVAIAQIADAGSWQSPCEGALYFHAARVSPGWHMTRIARVDDHVFYR